MSQNHTPRGTNAALGCIVCKRSMESIYGPNQPRDGLSFTSFGAYGSSFFDPGDGTFLEVTICDPCLAEHREAGRVIEHPATPETRAQSWQYADWGLSEADVALLDDAADITRSDGL